MRPPTMPRCGLICRSESPKRNEERRGRGFEHSEFSRADGCGRMPAVQRLRSVASTGRTSAACDKAVADHGDRAARKRLLPERQRRWSLGMAFSTLSMTDFKRLDLALSTPRCRSCARKDRRKAASRSICGEDSGRRAQHLAPTSGRACVPPTPGASTTRAARTAVPRASRAGAVLRSAAPCVRRRSRSMPGRGAAASANA